MLLINGTHVVDRTAGYIQSLTSHVRHPIGINEISLLNYMFSHQGKILSKQELMEEIWHKRGIVVESSSLLHSISSCRRGLEDRTGEVIRTERGVGYEFTGAVEQIDALPKPVLVEEEAASVECDKGTLMSEPSRWVNLRFDSMLGIKLALVCTLAMVVGFIATQWTEKLFTANKYDKASFSQCWYQPNGDGNKLYYHNPTLYKFEQLTLLIDERGRSVSFSNQSGVMTCE